MIFTWWISISLFSALCSFILVLTFMEFTWNIYFELVIWVLGNFISQRFIFSHLILLPWWGHGCLDILDASWNMTWSAHRKINYINLTLWQSLFSVSLWTCLLLQKYMALMLRFSAVLMLQFFHHFSTRIFPKFLWE